MTDSHAAAPCPTTSEEYGLGALVGTAYSGVFSYFGSFLVAAAVPWFLVLLVQGYLTYDLQTTLQAAIASGEVNKYSFLKSFQGQAQTVMWLEFGAGLLTSIVFAVSWHRFMLGHGRPRLLPALAGRHLVFFGYSLLLVLPLAGGMLLGGIVSGMFRTNSQFMALLPVIAGALVGAYVALRLNLCLPAAAVEERSVGPGRSWEAMRGKVLTLFIASLVCALPLGLVFWLVQLPGEEWITQYLVAGEGFALVLGLQAVSGLLALMIAGLGVGALSQALRSLIPDPAGP